MADRAGAGHDTTREELEAMTMFGAHPGATWLDDISVELLENDPYPVFARLRREAPIAWIPALQAWVASTWKDCWEIASDFPNFGGTTDPNTEHLARPSPRRRLAAIRDRGSAELMSEYFEPISVRAVGDLLGFQEVDSDTLRRWFHDLSTGFANKALHPEGFEPSDRATADIKAFVDPKLERLAKEPDDS